MWASPGTTTGGRIRRRSLTATVLTLGLGAAAGALATPIAGASTTQASQVVVQAASPLAAAGTQLGATPAATTIEFSVSLQLRNPAGAASFAQAVSEPASPSYGQYLTPAGWEARFSPSEGTVALVSAWLRSRAITVTSVTPDRMTIHASASAATIEQACATSLGEFSEQGHVLRLASGALKVPNTLAALIAGVSGVNESLARPTGLAGADVPSKAAKPAKGAPIGPPAGFRSAPPCSTYYGQKPDKTDPAYGDGFPNPLPYAVCGYKPAQLQGAYGLSSTRCPPPRAGPSTTSFPPASRRWPGLTTSTGPTRKKGC